MVSDNLSKKESSILEWLDEIVDWTLLEEDDFKELILDINEQINEQETSLAFLTSLTDKITVLVSDGLLKNDPALKDIIMALNDLKNNNTKNITGKIQSNANNILEDDPKRTQKSRINKVVKNTDTHHLKNLEWALQELSPKKGTSENAEEKLKTEILEQIESVKHLINWAKHWHEWNKLELITEADKKLEDEIKQLTHIDDYEIFKEQALTVLFSLISSLSTIKDSQNKKNYFMTYT